ncbi:MAG: MlaE family lipid ABC transporter permease subunit [Deltaproteobacteria bacterium]|nr:MlaE family lipid ABC transporter permease subunit [Deltaproteobacteria bacterium]MCB9490321.1 MlaE family lipid ABC transporter permease subunit [Deltaproteobacteria bacterium]
MAKSRKVLVESDSARSFDLRVEEAGDPARVHISGRLSLTNAGAVYKEISPILKRVSAKQVVVDLSDLHYIDAGGAAVLLAAEKWCRKNGKTFNLEGLTGSVAGLLSLVDRKKLTELELASAPKPPGLILQVGEASIHMMDDVRQMVTFVGAATIGMAAAFLKPRQIRWRDTFFYMDRAGTDALPIVGLISLLMGLILGFQAVVQLAQFGANIYIADLVGLSVLRELGPLMTCILVAGRSGSAFAAEIGTMKVSEEVDALTTMGFDPIRFLVVPKVLALVTMVPLLTLYADFLGLIGGMIVGMSLGDLTMSAYISESSKALDLWDIGQGLMKAEAFGIVIALVGCMRGFQVRGGAASVGQYTTSAVVTSIFLVIIVDSVFTLIFQYWGL